MILTLVSEISQTIILVFIVESGSIILGSFRSLDRTARSVHPYFHKKLSGDKSLWRNWLYGLQIKIWLNSWSFRKTGSFKDTFFDIKVRVALVAYRDYSEADLHFEIMDFTENVTEFINFISNVTIYYILLQAFASLRIKQIIYRTFIY